VRSSLAARVAVRTLCQPVWRFSIRYDSSNAHVSGLIPLAGIDRRVAGSDRRRSPNHNDSRTSPPRPPRRAVIRGQTPPQTTAHSQTGMNPERSTSRQP
jgi:hypothetical protein